MQLWIWLAAATVSVLGALVLFLKGRRIMLLLGLTGVVPALWLAPFLIAHPDSWWARRFYGAEKLARAAREEARRRERWAE